MYAYIRIDAIKEIKHLFKNTIQMSYHRIYFEAGNLNGLSHVMQ